MGCGLSKAHIRPEVLVFHGNARTTVHGRQPIVDRHAAGWARAHIATAMGVSRESGRSWITRYAAEGEAGLVDRSSRPHTTPPRTPVEVEGRIVAARTTVGVPPGTSSSTSSGPSTTRAGRPQDGGCLSAPHLRQREVAAMRVLLGDH